MGYSLDLKIVSGVTSRSGSEILFGLACCSLSPGLIALLSFRLKAQNPEVKVT